MLDTSAANLVAGDADLRWNSSPSSSSFDLSRRDFEPGFKFSFSRNSVT